MNPSPSPAPRRAPRRDAIGLLTAVMIALSVSACSGGGKGEKLEEALIQEVKVGDLVDDIIESGKIAAWYEVDIKSKVSGEVKSVSVKEGEPVQKGQLLMEIDEVDYRRQVALADVDYKETQLNLKNAEIDLARNKAAFEARGISKYELDRAQQAVELARVRLERAKVQLETRRDQLRYTKIYSPMDGIVTRRNIEPGEIVTAGITATVNGEAQLTIADLNRLQLELSMNQVDVARVKVGQKASVTLDAYREQPVEGEVITIAAAANTDQTKGIDVFKVKVSVDPSKTGLEIKPGMTAEVKVHVGSWPKVVKVPLETVFEEDGKNYIFVVKQDAADPKKQVKEKIEVQLGRKGNQEVEIAKGLEPGQKIYTRGEGKDLEMKM